YGYSAGGVVRAYHYWNPTDNTVKLWIGDDVVSINEFGIKVMNHVEVTGTLTAASVQYADPQLRVMSVSAVAFLPSVSTVGYGIANSGRYVTDAGSTQTLTAPLNLPNGAVIDH